jgi:hypothetical protein
MSRRLGAPQQTITLQPVTHRFGRTYANQIGMQFQVCPSPIAHRTMCPRVAKGVKHRLPCVPTTRAVLTKEKGA